MMKRLLFLLLLTGLGFGQVRSGAVKQGGASVGTPSTSTGNNAQADFDARCNATGVVRCSSVSGVGTPGSWAAYPINQVPAGAPNVGGTGGYFDYLGTNTDGTNTGIPDSSVFTVNSGSTRFVMPGGNSQATGGEARFQPLQDTSAVFYEGSPFGNDFYVQFRQRMSTNFLLWSSERTDDGWKDWLASAADRYVSGSPQTYATMGQCSDLQFVGGDVVGGFMHLPVLYYGCSANGTQDGGQMNIQPARSSDNLYQNGLGCSFQNTRNRQKITISSAVRVSNVVTLTLALTPTSGYTVGATIFVIGVPTADLTSSNNVQFNGIYTITAVNAGAKTVSYSQQGPNQSVTAGGSAQISAPDFTHCFQYQANEWMTYMWHIVAGSDYINNSHNYRRNSVIELYAAHEGQPYQLLISVPDLDLVLHDQGNTAQTIRINGASTQVGPPAIPPLSNWWAATGLVPGFQRVATLMYQSDRCNSLANILTVSRTAGVSKLTYNVPTQGNGVSSGWNNGAGSACPTAGDTITIANVTTDGGSFNGTYTICTTGTAGCSAPSSGALFFVQAGNTVGSTNVAGLSPAPTVTDPRYIYNCNGGQCTATKWVTELTFSQKFISNPKVCSGASGCGGVADAITVKVPDPADHLRVTGLDGSGHPQLAWRCNDSNSATYKILRVTGDKYSADLAQATGGGWLTATQAGTASACVSQFGTQTFTDSTSVSGTQYSYSVVATNAFGDATRSNAAMNTPGIPSDVTATAGSSNTIALTWTPQPPLTQTGFKVQRCAGSAFAGSCTISGAGWADIAAGTCSGTLASGATGCTDTDTLTTGQSYVYRVEALLGALTTQSWGGTPANNTVWGGNTGASQATASASGFLGLPTGSGWHALGNAGYASGAYLDTALTTSPADNVAPVIAPSSGSSNQCLVNNYNGTSYSFNSLCKWVIDSQSSGVADTNRNYYYLFGGGHSNYGGNEIYRFDLSANPVTLRRVKNPTTKDGSGNLAMSYSGAGGDPNFGFPAGDYAGLPADITSTSFSISSINGNAGSGTIDIVISSAANFIVPDTTAQSGKGTNLKEGKGYAQVQGTTNFNSTYRVSKLCDTNVTCNSVANGTPVTHFQVIGTKNVATETAGTASYTWSSCIADTAGQGCAPASTHTTQSIGMIQNMADHTQDAFFKFGGAIYANSGDTPTDMWTIPLNGGITDSSVWTAQNHVTGFVAPSAVFNFPEYSDFDTTSGCLYILDHQGTFYCYDLFGTTGTNTPNKFYTVVSAWANSSAMSSVVWHNSGDTQRFFWAASGCTQSQITNASLVSTTETLTLNGISPSLSGSNVGKFWVYNSSNATFNADAITSFTLTTGASPTIAFTNGSASGTSSGGFIIWCQAGDGVFLADVTNGTTSTPANTRLDWTNATFANSNLDLGTVGYNSCAEAMSGGLYVSASPWVGPLNGTTDANGRFSSNGGISPGITLYTGSTVAGVANSGDVIVWPNEGTNIYAVTFDTVNSKLQCRRVGFTGTVSQDTPANTSNNNGATNSTWGTWKRFSYFPQPDVFFLVNSPTQPARILRIH